MIKQAAQYHVEGLIAAGLPVPKPTSRLDELEVDVPTRSRSGSGKLSALVLGKFQAVVRRPGASNKASRGKGSSKRKRR